MRKIAIFPVLSALILAVACTPKDPESGSTGNESLTGDYGVSDDIASIPCPPDSMRWVLNDSLSDEFDGDKLDDSKWLDYHPTWTGREPGIFLKSQVKVEDGMLVLTGEKMDKDTVVYMWNGTPVTYNIRCAAVVSKHHAASYGYYESKIKANKTTLSTTFWMSNRDGAKSTEGLQPEGAREGKFHQELDILECVGRSGAFTGSSFSEGMHSNVHYWFTPTGGEQEDNRAKETKLTLPNGEIPSDGFNVYGCWWRDKQSASFYLNNGQESHVDFIVKDTGEPFYFPRRMGLNMVLETYPYPWIELPNDVELADPTKNKNYYEWVRHYILVPFDAPYEKASETVVFENHVHFNKRLTIQKSVDGSFTVPFSYTAATDSEIEFALIDKDEKVVASQTIAAYAGYGNYDAFALDASKLTLESRYFLVANIRPAGAADNSASYEEDSFQFKYMGEK